MITGARFSQVGTVPAGRTPFVTDFITFLETKRFVLGDILDLLVADAPVAGMSV